MNDCPYGCDECPEFNRCPYDDQEDDIDYEDYYDPPPQCQECLVDAEARGIVPECALCPLGGMDPYDVACWQADIAAHDPERKPHDEPPPDEDVPF